MVILLAMIMTVIIQFHVIHNKIFPIFMWPNFCWQQYSIQNLDHNEWVGVMRVSCFSFGYEVTITLKLVLITVRIYHVFYDIQKKNQYQKDHLTSTQFALCEFDTETFIMLIRSERNLTREPNIEVKINRY